MLILKYFGLQLIQHFTIFWGYVVGITAVELTLIGHIKGWRRINYPKRLMWISKNRKYGYELLCDHNTHPQVLLYLLGAMLVLGGAIGIIIGVWQVINEIDTWILWAIGAALYVPSTILLISVKKRAKRTYYSYLSKSEQTHRNESNQ